MEKELPDNWREYFGKNVQGIKWKGIQAIGLCPFHEDKKPSFSVNSETSQWICYAGCGKGNFWTFKKMLESKGTYRAPDPSPEFEQPSKKLIAAYTYHDEYGAPLYQVLRYEPKSFMQRHIQSDGKMKWEMKGVKKYPYNLPDLQKRKDEVLWWVEGEKDSNILMKEGILSSTSSGGASGFDKEIFKYIPQRKMVLIPDNDEPGLLYGEEVRQDFLSGNILNSCAILKLPEEYKDVSDYLLKNSVTRLKEYARNNISFYASDQEPLLFFKEKGIEMPDWNRDRGGSRIYFIKGIIAQAFCLMDEWDDSFSPLIDSIDLMAKKARTPMGYLLLLKELKKLVELKGMLNGLH